MKGNDPANDPIGRTKAFRLLNEMHGWDRQRLLLYLKSDYLSVRRSLDRTAEALIQVLDAPETTKRDFFARSFPKEKLSHTRGQERLSHLMEAVKHFVALEHLLRRMQNDPDSARLFYVRGLRDLARNTAVYDNELFWQDYLSQARKLTRSLDETYRTDLLAEAEEEYCLVYSSYLQRGGKTGSAGMGPVESYTVAKIRADDRNYYVRRLRETCIVLANVLIAGQSYSMDWEAQTREIGEVIGRNEATSDILRDPQVRFFRKLMEVLRHAVTARGEGRTRLSVDEGSILELHSIFRSARAMFDEDPRGAGLLGNVLITLISEGHQKAPGLLFDLNSRMMLQNKALDPNGKVPAGAFRSTVTLGYTLGKHCSGVSDALIERLGSKLSVTHSARTALLRLCEAWKALCAGNFRAAYLQSEGLRPSDPVSRIQVQDLRFKAAFSMEMNPRAASGLALDLAAVLTDVQASVAEAGNLSTSAVKVARHKLPLITLLVRIVSGELSVSGLQKAREEFRAGLRSVALPWYESDWLEKALQMTQT